MKWHLLRLSSAVDFSHEVVYFENENAFMDQMTWYFPTAGHSS